MDLSISLVYLLLLTASEAEVIAAADTGIVFPPQAALHGSLLTLNCSYEVQKEASQVRVSWLLGETPSSDCKTNTLEEVFSKMVKGQQNTDGNQVTGHAWSSIKPSDVSTYKDKWCFCRVVVEIPVLEDICSNGTQVKISSPVKDSPSTRATVPNGNPGQWVWLAVGAGSLILLALITYVLVLYRRKTCKTAENPIYENMRPVVPNPPKPFPRTIKPGSNKYIEPGAPNTSRMDGADSSPKLET
ncbi:hypothetical protein AGOR_G00145960 [Albula goreensis]|uniref:Ig-like domain-containing protein n=1 Tax=Albula goreensis TaxID=1534307 RepID=A0A8T3D6A4_9TELE|nr:hypothetical protein AGOR_G00145960 [Albula goreensis]